ncbi:MAG: RagB/SusD family nutrient uptake outer membrane protein [Cyclobacteriaceae bacterium]|nr:RagB/SusD family nutrient uptake outer membrane protein [Cyclobacteriaceae bacterium]
MKRIITMLIHNRNVLVSSLMMLIVTGCEEFIRIDPPKTEITAETVFTSDAAAQSAIRGIYSLMMTNQSFTKGELERYTGLSSDELLVYSSNNEQQQFYFPSLLATNNILYSTFWSEAYKYILNANAMLEGLQRSFGLSPIMRQQLEGEAKFIRAFAHFYLANLFGDIPYVTTTDYRVNASASRLPLENVYEFIREDLKQAYELMVEDFSFSANERTQPNKWAAMALQSRVCLYTGDWEKAEQLTTQLIDNGSLFSLEDDLNKVFLKESKEAIWQLKPVVAGTNTFQGQLFILTTVPANSLGRVSLSPDVIGMFESDDERSDAWIGTFTNGSDNYYYAHKYKIDYSAVLTEYNTVLRLAEQYLIRAEARAHLNNMEGAKADINAIRSRAGLAGTDADDLTSLLTAIAHERQAEFFAEWGHRWLDLKRTNRVNEVLTLVKPDWQPTDVLYPIPQSERLVNPNLTQNEGY